MRVPSNRTLATITAGGVAATLVAVAALVLLGRVGPVATLTLLAAGTALAATCMAAVVLVRLKALVDMLDQRQRDDRDRLVTLHEQGMTTKNAIDALERIVSRQLTAADRNARQHYAQLEALGDLRHLFAPRAPMPAGRGWAASPDVIHTLVELIWARRPRLVVECGSGASSVWLGYALEKVGEGALVALEHDERFAASARDLIRAHGLDGVVDVRLAPLRPWSAGEKPVPWYDTTVLDDLDGIGMVFVDGPPGSLGPLARYPALPVLLPLCTSHAAFVLDDTARTDEQAISNRWMAENPDLERVIYSFDKGAHVLYHPGK
jgi:predicted O-methyltransferase YrrM